MRFLVNTRPDLAYGVGLISRFMQRPNSSHFAVAKRILRYLKGTLDYGILFPHDLKSETTRMVGYTDSNWCGD